MIRILASLALLSLVSTTSAAQLRGTVRDSTSGLPVPGAVVLALDTRGDQIARSITTERGEFTLRVSRAPKRVQVLRIGFRPSITEIANAESRLEITMVAIPTLLQPISVFDQPNCPRRSDAPAAFALWEQTKAGLLATVVAREVNPARVVRLHFDRRFSRTADTTDYLEVRIDSAATTQPFVAAREAADFIEQGFVDDAGGVRVFHAPDAEVLLDAAFPRGYCFEIAKSDAARPREVGLGFHAARRRAGRIDIVGTVWIDTSSRSLTDIVYRYADLDARFERARAGGRVSFRTMTNGTVLIDRWHIRLIAGVPRKKSGPAAPIGPDDYEIHEKGGEVASARWPDGGVWNASLGRISGQAWYRDKPATGARLRLFETSYETITDSSGHFEFTQLLPGPYSIGAVDPILDALAITLRTGASFTAARDSALRVSLNVPTAADYVAAACETMGFGSAGNYSLVGQVVDPDGGLARAAQYQVSRNTAGVRQAIIEGRTDERGTFVLCSTSHNDVLEIFAKHGRFNATATYRADHRLGTLRIPLRSPSPQ